MCVRPEGSGILGALTGVPPEERPPLVRALHRLAAAADEQTVRRVEELTRLHLADDPEGEPAQYRRAGLGALLGIVAGLGTGTAYELLRPQLRRVPPPSARVGGRRLSGR